MKKILIVDGNALIHRGYHAIPATFQTPTGETVNAVFGFTSMLLNALRSERPDLCAMTFDLKGPTFRSAEYTEYKATRQKSPDDLYAQIPRIRNLVETLNIPIFEREGFEADDMIGTISKKAGDSGMESIILTGDMDSFQLVDEKTFILTPQGGFQKPKKYDGNAVLERLGVLPEQVVDYKALRGDTSDNIPGVPGIGEKYAVELLSKFKSLDGIYENLSSIGGALQAKLSAGRESGYMSRRLATIVRDIDIEIPFDRCSVELMNIDRGLELFAELQFRSLIGKLHEIRRLANARPDAHVQKAKSAPLETQQSLF